MQKLFPKWLFDYIVNNYIIDYIYEIRIRLNKPIIVNYRGNYEVLSEKNNYNSKPIISNNELINYIMTVATKQSIYAYNDEIKHCYIQGENGIRIGICGTVVYNNGKILTIKNITSLNVRIAHQVINCSKSIIDFICFNKCIKNTLILSPPAQGKTTFIRDIAYQLSNYKGINNILIIDERFEIAGGYLSDINVGKTTDIISGCEKSYAFYDTIKTMSPSVIITDEISSESDIESIKQTIRSGVKVIATTHAESISDVKSKKYFDVMLNLKYFDRIIVLSGRNGVGTIEGVFDENFRALYVPYLK
ncbi:MAG: stage III sporulation protein AA [Clostridia bacterium]|nr:stage III sporulation protein AA [Clostridia bacterium]